MQEGEANAGLQGFCRLHCDVFSVSSCLLPCGWGSLLGQPGVCWQLRFTELALALKAEGRAAVSGKLSSPRSHTTHPRIALGSRLGVQQECLWKGLLPMEPLPPCAPTKGCSGKQGLFKRQQFSKGTKTSRLSAQRGRAAQTEQCSGFCRLVSH